MEETPVSTLRGRWRILAVEDDGEREKSLSTDQLYARIEGDEFIIEWEGKEWSRGHFRWEPAAHRFDFLRGENVAPGIYDLEENRLTICVNLSGYHTNRLGATFDPPTSFSTTPGSGRRMWIMERVKTGKAKFKF